MTQLAKAIALALVAAGLAACGTAVGGPTKPDDPVDPPPPPPPSECQPDTILDLPLRSEEPDNCTYSQTSSFASSCLITGIVIQGTQDPPTDMEWERPASDALNRPIALGAGASHLGGPGWETDSKAQFNTARADWSNGDYIVRIDPSSDGNIPCNTYGDVRIKFNLHE